MIHLSNETFRESETELDANLWTILRYIFPFSIELDGLRGCMESVIKSCFTQPLNNMVLKFMLVKLVTKDLFCDKAGLMFPNVVDNTTLSCKLTTSEYVSKINSCSNKTYKMWKENRADRAICG